MVKVNKIEVKMSILEELSNPIRQIDAETATNTRSERSRGRTQRKAYKYYVAVGAMKKYGFTRFVLPDGSVRSFGDLIAHPVVPDANKPIYIPIANGSVVDLDGNVIFTAAED